MLKNREILNTSFYLSLLIIFYLEMYALFFFHTISLKKYQLLLVLNI